MGPPLKYHSIEEKLQARKKNKKRWAENTKDKPCTRCGSIPRKYNSSWCQKCINKNGNENWRKLPKEKQQERWLKMKYNLTLQDYLLLYQQQDGVCRICQILISPTIRDNSATRACVDHCHVTNKVRGLLCNHCNRALGLLKENKEAIKNMLDYLS